MWDFLFSNFLNKSFKHGTLILHLPSGKTLQLGDGIGAPVEVTMHDPALTRKIMTTPDMQWVRSI
jgi:hypothetical protein